MKMLLEFFKSAWVDGHCLKAFCLQWVKGTVCWREMNPCSRSLRKGPLKIELLFACSTQTGGNYFKLDITQQVLKYFHYIEVNCFFLSGLQIAFCSSIAHFYFFFFCISLVIESLSMNICVKLTHIYSLSSICDPVVSPSGISVGR